MQGCLRLLWLWQAPKPHFPRADAHVCAILFECGAGRALRPSQSSPRIQTNSRRRSALYPIAGSSARKMLEQRRKAEKRLEIFLGVPAWRTPQPHASGWTPGNDGILDPCDICISDGARRRPTGRSREFRCGVGTRRRMASWELDCGSWFTLKRLPYAVGSRLRERHGSQTFAFGSGNTFVPIEARMVNRYLRFGCARHLCPASV